VRHLRTLLARKEIEYLDLKRALVPNTDRSERAFLFDWNAMDSGLYGVRVRHCLLPALPKSSTRSVLAGDWASQWRPRAALRDSGIELIPAGSSRRQELPDTLYVVHLNNLTSSMGHEDRRSIREPAKPRGRVGHTHGSIFKAMPSTMLVRDFVQHKGIVLLGHEDEDHSLKLSQSTASSVQRALVDIRHPTCPTRSSARCSISITGSEVLAQRDDTGADTAGRLRGDP
jgi:hypothetical protein